MSCWAMLRLHSLLSNCGVVESLKLSLGIHRVPYATSITASAVHQAKDRGELFGNNSSVFWRIFFSESLWIFSPENVHQVYLQNRLLKNYEQIFFLLNINLNYKFLPSVGESWIVAERKFGSCW